jgi:hypothetical protein
VLWHDFYAPMIPFPRGANVLLAAVVISLFALAWHHIQRQVKQLFFMALAINLPLWLAFCYTDEMRNLSFVFLPAFLMASHALPRLVDNTAKNPVAG